MEDEAGEGKGERARAGEGAEGEEKEQKEDCELKLEEKHGEEKDCYLQW